MLVYLSAINRLHQTKMNCFRLNKLMLQSNGLYHFKTDGKMKTFCLKVFSIFLIFLFFTQSLQSALIIRKSGADDPVKTCCSVLQSGR